MAVLGPLEVGAETRRVGRYPIRGMRELGSAATNRRFIEIIEANQAKLKQESLKAWRRHCSVNRRTMSKLMRPADAYFGEGASTDQVHRKAIAVPGRA